MTRLLAFLVRATWAWAAALTITLLAFDATAAPAPATFSATGLISTLRETTISEFPRGAGAGIELTAIGHARDGSVHVARERLGSDVYREASPHRLTRLSGAPPRWEACWRICRRTPRGDDILGCLRRVVLGNNHPDPRVRPTGVLRLEWTFDIASQRFRLDPTELPYLPPPRELAQRSFSGLRFHVPLPLDSTTPALAKRAIRLRGGDISPTPESADVLLLPDRADYCIYDRASRPAGPIAALRRGVPVLYERNLEGVPRLTPAP